MTSAIWMPQGPGRIARDIPAPMAAWLGTFPEMDAAVPTLWTRTGDTAETVRQWGIGRRYDAITKYSQRPDIRLATVPLTILCVFNKVTTGQGYLASMGGSGAGGKGWFAGISGTNKLEFGFGGVAAYASTGATISVGVQQVVGYVIQGNGFTNGVRFFRNGVLDGTATPGTITTPSSQPLTIGCIHNNTVFQLPANSDIGLFVYWQQALTDELMQAFTSNPWQLFEGPFRTVRPDTFTATTTYTPRLALMGVG